MDEFHKRSTKVDTKKYILCGVIHLYGFLDQARTTYGYRNQISSSFWEAVTDWKSIGRLYE